MQQVVIAKLADEMQPAFCNYLNRGHGALMQLRAALAGPMHVYQAV